LLAERWDLTPDLTDVIQFHHDVQSATAHRELVAVVALSDLLCRMEAMGHGYNEKRQVSFLDEPGFALLRSACPGLETFDWARFTFELEAYVDEVHRLVSVMYRSQ
jgi:hypothetical protein